MSPKARAELERVLDAEIKEWHFHIYFHQNNVDEHDAALKLRDSVLRLRRDGAFIAVPLFRVNTAPMGPHPVGSYEIWVPSETFSSVFSYLCINRGSLRFDFRISLYLPSFELTSVLFSILVHPITREQRRDHDTRAAWIGQPYPLDLSTLPITSADIPVQYKSLKVGYSAQNALTVDQRLTLGSNVERILQSEKEAARAPPRE
ncbi:hypothetical protein D9613_003347 [Agrocybe pediades]|uniref:Uncharacterized protein n=1 Tax=Agrocybe pediades TaxID=84607 RepID=A0A8H4QQA0_9AGAR|nr:hypothetical protein D9613_003347 [Agrocybe pediades]